MYPTTADQSKGAIQQVLQSAEALAEGKGTDELPIQLRLLRKKKPRSACVDKRALKLEETQRAVAELQLKNKELEQNTQYLKETIAAQQSEISALKKSQQAMEQRQAFFTPEMQKMLLFKLSKQEKKRKARLPNQAQLVTALLKGDLEEARRQESEGALLTEPNGQGTYPLEAAVYGLDIEAVKYIEGRLEEDEVNRQWSYVDKRKVVEKYEQALPTKLSPGATYGELSTWYKNNACKGGWSGKYDKMCLKKEGCERWQQSVWQERGNSLVDESLPLNLENAVITNVPIYYEHGTYYGGEMRVLHAPSRTVHDAIVRAIYEQLETLKNIVETKASKQPGVNFNV